MELIHKQSVRWTHDRVVACDGGGGPLGHPRIYINTDKPQVCWCTYCGLPFVSEPQDLTLGLSYTSLLIMRKANEHHRKHLESLPSTSYPLGPTSDPAEVSAPRRVTG